MVIRNGLLLAERKSVSAEGEKIKTCYDTICCKKPVSEDGETIKWLYDTVCCLLKESQSLQKER